MATQQRLDTLFTKYYDSDLKNICEKYDELCEQFKIANEKKKNLRSIATYPPKINLSVSSLRSAIAKEIKSITPKEVIEGAKKRKLERKQKEAEKKKRKYRKSHRMICAKCQGKDFLGIYHKYNDGGYCTLPSGKQLEGYSPSFSNVCGSDQMMLNICVDCGYVQGLEIDLLKKQIANAEGEGTLAEEEGESSTDEVLYYGVTAGGVDEDDESSSDDDNEEEEEEYEEEE